MAKQAIPVFNIDDFGHQQDDFYANTIPLHLKHHHFVNAPHKHNFYLTMIFTKGKGVHEIDFKKYKVKPGSVFVMFPGQTHNWKLSNDIDGYIFFHSGEFFDLHFHSVKISDYPFFHLTDSTSMFQLKSRERERIETLFKNILKEHRNEFPLKDHKIRTLVNGLYIELMRIYVSPEVASASEIYLSKLKEFEGLLENNFKQIKLPGKYAEMLNVSERHLNRICKTSLNKTTSEIILNRVVLEAKRLLVNTSWSTAQIASELGYDDNSYFSRIFKKGAGLTPLMFRKQNKFGA